MATSSKSEKSLPRSVRKHLRQQKAILRRTLPREEADKAIEQLVRGFRRS